MQPRRELLRNAGQVIRQYVGQSSQSRVDLPGLGAIETYGAGPSGFAVPAYTVSQAWSDAGDAASQPWDTRGTLVGRRLWEAMGAYDRSLQLFVMTDDEMHPDNRVTLAADGASDEHGRVPHVTYRGTPASAARRDELCRWAGNILRAAGAASVHRADSPALYVHMQSSMRMGRDPASSVVDHNQEAWEVKRLFVTDGSSLPDALGGPNPTLTIQMFATRTAEHIATAHFDRDPFVREGAGTVHPAGFPP